MAPRAPKLSNGTTKPKKSYGTMAEEAETRKRFAAVKKYVNEINKIVNAGPKGGNYAMTAVIKDIRSNQPDIQAVSMDKPYNRVSKRDAALASKTGVVYNNKYVKTKAR
jgi:hypothetical protein